MILFIFQFSGRVNCLSYPNNDHPRYDVAHLVSGYVFHYLFNNMTTIVEYHFRVGMQN